MIRLLSFLLPTFASLEVIEVVEDKIFKKEFAGELFAVAQNDLQAAITLNSDHLLITHILRNEMSWRILTPRMARVSSRLLRPKATPRI